MTSRITTNHHGTVSEMVRNIYQIYVHVFRHADRATEDHPETDAAGVEGITQFFQGPRRDA